jgi:hypothetical protein
MASHEMFLTMILKNARRMEAKGVLLSVDNAKPRIDMLLWDGSSQPMTSPPADVVAKMIGVLESGQTDFRSTVFVVRVNAVQIQRENTMLAAHISAWDIQHVDEMDEDS